MKRIVWGLILGTFTSVNVESAVITHWNFNSSPPDASSTTGTSGPAAGGGTASLLGSVTASFSGGSGSDTNSDNTGWNTASYPGQGTANKTAGVQFNVSTRGFSNIVVSFEQRPTGTASKYYRFQYSANGTDFVDFAVINLSAANTFHPEAIPLGNITAVEDNPNFAFRVVSEFENSATGAGAAGYAPVSGTSYSTAGTVRFDLVTISGDPLSPGNTPPSISNIANVQLNENSSTGPIPFEVGDAETPPADLDVTALSSNLQLIPLSRILLGGLDEARTVEITPEPGQFGVATITLTVTDEGGLFAVESFLVTVLPLNTPPVLSAIPHQHTLVNTPTAPIPFTVEDAQSAPSLLTPALSSSNPTLVPVSNILLSGTGTNRTVTLTPASGESGTALIKITFTDPGTRSSSASFVLMVVPTATALLHETFSYDDGSLVTNTGMFWSTHGGTAGQTRITGGKLGIQGSQSEDINTPLLRSPHTPESNGTLYVSFDLTFSTFPSSGGDYFAHFGSSTFRGRLFAGTANAASGRLRLGLSNGGSTPNVQLATDLATGTSYKVVLRYTVGSPSTTLWIDPAGEADPSVTAADSVSTASISAFSIRQASGIGNSTLDNLKVATSFSDVVNATAPRIAIRRTANGAEIVWPMAARDAGYKLESSSFPTSGDWPDVEEQPQVDGTNLVLPVNGTTADWFYRLVRP